MLGLTVAVLGTLAGTLIFLVQIVRTEVPIMVKNEKAMKGILKENLIYCYLKSEEASADLKEAIKYLFYRKNFKEVYKDVQDEYDHEYNQYVLMKLLEFQRDLAYEIKEKYDEREQKIIASSLLENVCDIIFRHVEISEEMYVGIVKNNHLLLGTLYSIYKLQGTKENFLEKLEMLYRALEFPTQDREMEKDLISDIIVVFIGETIKDNDLSVIKAIRRRLSDFDYCLTVECPALDVFAVISMYLYYLVCSEPDVPDKLKNELTVFVSEDNIIEGKIKITSWKELFLRAAADFKVDYNHFSSLISRNSIHLRYYLFGSGPKNVVLHGGYWSQWFLTNLCNTRNSDLIDYGLLISKHQGIKYHLINFCDLCMDENRNFIPTQDMKQIVEFYGDGDEQFICFRIEEECTHRLFDFINEIKRAELKDKYEKTGSIKNIELADTIHNNIEYAIKNEWGYDSGILTQNPERYFSVMLERAFEVESIIRYSTNSVFLDIGKVIRKTVLYKGDFSEDNIRKLLSKIPRYITANTKETMSRISFQDEAVKEDFLNTCRDLEEFRSRLLGRMTLVTENGFRFNCVIEKVEIRDLSENEIAKEIDRYQRADGQFVFEGVFLPREEIEKIIKNKFMVLTVIIKHKIDASEDTVFELKPFSKQVKD